MSYLSDPVVLGKNDQLPAVDAERFCEIVADVCFLLLGLVMGLSAGW